MMLKTIITEQLDEDGTLRTFTMDASGQSGRITVAMPNEYKDPRNAPFYFLNEE